MTVWRWCSVALVVMALWQLTVGLRSATSPAPTRADLVPMQELSAEASADPSTQSSWDTTGEASFSSAPPLSLGLAPLESGPEDKARDWERRLLDARSEQLRLESMPELTPAQRAAELRAHLEQHFSAAERPHVGAGLRMMPR